MPWVSRVAPLASFDQGDSHHHRDRHSNSELVSDVHSTGYAITDEYLRQVGDAHIHRYGIRDPFSERQPHSNGERYHHRYPLAYRHCNALGHALPHGDALSYGDAHASGEPESHGISDGSATHSHGISDRSAPHFHGDRSTGDTDSDSDRDPVCDRDTPNPDQDGNPLNSNRRQMESRVVRRGLLAILVASTVLLYCLGAASMWARRQFLNVPTATPPATPSSSPTAPASSVEANRLF